MPCIKTRTPLSDQEQPPPPPFPRPRDQRADPSACGVIKPCGETTVHCSPPVLSRPRGPHTDTTEQRSRSFRDRRKGQKIRRNRERVYIYIYMEAAFLSRTSRGGGGGGVQREEEEEGSLDCRSSKRNVSKRLEQSDSLVESRTSIIRGRPVDSRLNRLAWKLQR